MIIFRHILKAHIAPFIGSFFVLMFLFVLQFMMKFMDQLAGKGLSGAIILELMMLNLAWIVVLAVPMAVLVATLMAFGALSASSEITAMKASGVSFYRMMLPVLLAAVVLTYLMVQFDNKVLPEANHRLKTLTIDIRRKKPTFTLIPGLFSQDLPGTACSSEKHSRSPITSRASLFMIIPIPQRMLSSLPSGASFHFHPTIAASSWICTTARFTNSQPPITNPIASFNSVVKS